MHDISNRVAGKTAIIRLHGPWQYIRNRYDMHAYYMKQVATANVYHTRIFIGQRPQRIGRQASLWQ
jgi:hypothetical protein